MVSINTNAARPVAQTSMEFTKDPSRNIGDSKTCTAHPDHDQVNKAQHNFRSMADLIRNKDSGRSEESLEDGTSPNNDSNNIDDKVHDCINNGPNVDIMGNIGVIRQDHLRRWYTGNLGTRNCDSYNIDIDADSSHSGIPNELNSKWEYEQKKILREDDVGVTGLNKKDVTIDIMLGDNEEENTVNITNKNIISDTDNVSEIGETDARKSKRKQSTPKPRDKHSISLDEIPIKVCKTRNNTFQEQLNFMQQQLKYMQERLMIQVSDKSNGLKSNLSEHRLNMSNHDSSNVTFNKVDKNTLIEKKSDFKRYTGQIPKHSNDINVYNSLPQQCSSLYDEAPKNFMYLAKLLKDEFKEQLGNLVESVVAKIASGVTSPKLTSHEFTQKHELTPQEHVNKQVFSRPQTNNDLTSCVQFNDKEFIEKAKVSSQRQDSQFSRINAPNKSCNASSLPPPVQLPHHEQHFCPKNNVENIKLPSYSFTPFMRHNIKHGKVEHNIDVPVSQKAKVNDKLINPYFDPVRCFRDFSRHQTTPWFPPLPLHPYAQSHSLHSAFSMNSICKEQEQTEALPLIVSSTKKKRTKVTDTRLSPRAARALLQEPVPAEQPLQGASTVPEQLNIGSNSQKEIQRPTNSLSSFHTSLGIPESLPTSVAVPNPSLQNSEVYGVYHNHHQSEQDQTANTFDSVDMEILHHHSTGSPLREDSSPSVSYTPSESPSQFKDCSDNRYSIDGNDDGFHIISFNG